MTVRSTINSAIDPAANSTRPPAPSPARDESGGESPFIVRFWGVRGSIASPGPATVRYGGNTACIEVRCGGAHIVFDCGTGIRPLGESLARDGGPADIDLLLTHSHLDHISGLPFFAPAFDPASRLRLWSGHLPPERPFRTVLADMMTAPLFPVPVEIFRADCQFRDFQAGQTLELAPGVPAGVVVRTCRLNHPDGATGYRVEHDGRSLCVLTDTEHPAEGRDPVILELLRGADVMVYDSTYTDAEYPTRVGWGHSTWQECLRLAEAAGVGRAVIFHHDPARTDDALDAIAAEAAAMRPGSLVAYEGMELSL
ncbi:MBL fold metallo-hydrolase [Azospirillum oryzae]|uniref:MBL fold metallo-hydrolase n=1 Tax=Azospirillum oryzae TaxID=286727 RepID=UPI001FE57AA7|nr:MBL fold metallo-hydrolase [Azospirillum oryzae]GLR82816.1 MBL fold metallo-hydrolase [Azospirillum oryzae]